jgi:hypothetical protein
MQVVHKQKTTMGTGLLSKAVVDDAIDQKMYSNSEVRTKL